MPLVAFLGLERQECDAAGHRERDHPDHGVAGQTAGLRQFGQRVDVPHRDRVPVVGGRLAGNELVGIIAGGNNARIGDMELDQTLTSREIINTKMSTTLDIATDPWGIKVTRVEVKNILPPKDIQEAMEKQMRAERERRESILVAEGKKQAAILNAEGDKESLVLRATAEKEAQIAKAEGQATKIIVPNDLAGLAGTLTTLSESLKDPKKPE